MAMDQLRLYNTLSRRVEPVEKDGDRCGVYCCGPTVYAPAHIGNFRTFVAVDLLVRTLALASYDPFFVRNLTDIDDKTIAGSQAAGQGLEDFTGHWTEVFHRDCAALNLLPPAVEPRATDHINEQLAIIGRLVERGIAYERDGSVYFRIAAWKDYGRLSRLADRELLARENGRFAKDGAEDFVLWKAARESDGSVRYASPWGPGRPGWHIECSAMAWKHLGPNFSIHCGGVDLLFPHHENEIAQTEAAMDRPIARHWFHVAHLQIGGEKMSKSLGNLYTVADIVTAGHSSRTLRLALSSCHYGRELCFRPESLQSAGQALAQLDAVGKVLQKSSGGGRPMAQQFSRWQSVWEAVLEDLNLPLAIGRLFRGLRHWNPEKNANDDDWAEWQRLLFLLGLSLPPREEAVPDGIRSLAEERMAARRARDFIRADALRRKLADEGWAVRDTEDDYTLSRQQPRTG